LVAPPPMLCAIRNSCGVSESRADGRPQDCITQLRHLLRPQYADHRTLDRLMRAQHRAAVGR
jgi:hypothetical protein